MPGGILVEPIVQAAPRGDRRGWSASSGRVEVRLALALSVLLALVACSGGPDGADAATGDATGDAGVSVTPPDIPWLEDGVPPIAIAPCPDGWREADEDGVTTCDPYPEGGALECPPGQAHFPGEPGCTPVGSPCPAGDFAADLPADRRVIYVQPGASGGDGTEAAPYGGLMEFSLGALPLETVIALSRGSHDGPVRLSRGHTLRGACAEATVLRALEPAETESVVTLLGQGGAMRDLTLTDSPRLGIRASGADIECHLDGVMLSGMRLLGVIVADGAHLAAQSVVIRETAGRGLDGAFGRGISVERGATAEVDRALFVRNHEFATFVSEPDTVLTLADVVIRDTESQVSDGRHGRGLSVQRGATAEVSRGLLSRNRGVGVYASGAGSVLTMADVVVRDTEPDASGVSEGRGLLLQAGATAHVQRAVFEHNRDVGLYVSDAETVLTLADAAVRDTTSPASGEQGGWGLGVQLGATADVSRALFVRNVDAGMVALEAGTTLTLSDVVVRDTQSLESDQETGRGLSLIGSVTQAHRVLVERSHEIGVAAFEGAIAALEDVIASDTRSRACAETTCPESAAGHGVGSYGSDTSVHLTRFAVRRSALCGVHLADGGALDLEDGEVSGQPIGLCLQVDGYDADRLTNRVLFIDNDVNLQATTLPVPEPAAPAAVGM